MSMQNEASVVEHYNYHAFPRPRAGSPDQTKKGLAILESLIQSGFLLVPERVVWPGEFLKPDNRGESIIGYDRRVCFSYLHPSEVPVHAKAFGPFAVEYDHWALRTLGGLPVSYVPIGEKFEGYLGMGLALSARMADLQALLERLDAFLRMTEACPDVMAPMLVGPDGNGGLVIGPHQPNTPAVTFPKEIINRVRAEKGDSEFLSPKAAAPLGGNAGCVRTVLRLLTYGIQSFEVQLSNVRKFGGLFYPCERPGQEDLLTYYQQREWRILGGLMKEGVVGTRKPSEEEKQRLLTIDRDFFGKTIETRTRGPVPIAEECEFLTKVDDRHVLSYARRVICPKAVLDDARRLLDQGGLDKLPLVVIEALQQPV